MRSGDTQSSPTAHPDVRITVYGDTYASVDIGEVKARLLRAYTDEQAFGGEYIFEIDNSDESLNTKDYDGREISLTWGFVGGTASVFPPLWVDHMEYVSKEGRLLLVLHCIDNWGLLAQINSGMWNQRWNFPEDEWDATAGMCLPESQTAVPTSVRTALDAQTDKTILQVITNIIYYAVNRLVVCDTTDFDGIINVEKPPIVVPDARSGVIRALQSTKCYLKWVKESGVGRYRVWKPDAHAIAYTFSVSNLFFSNVYGVGLAIPNKIYYWAINTAGTDWVSGSAEDTTSSGRVGEIAEHYLYGDPYQKDIRASTTVLDNLASGVLDKVQSQRNQGELIAPMHCSLELFDKIRVIDDRYQGSGGGDDVTGYVHRIIREYDRGVYSIKVQLGGAVGGYTPSQGYPPTGMAKDPSDEVGRTTDPFVPEVDTTPPSDVVWETPAMTTGVILATEENQRDIVWVKGDWQAATDTGSGVAQYLVEWWTSETTDKHVQEYVQDHVAVIYDAKPNITYYMKVKAVDAQWNLSTNWSSTQSISSAKDTTAPNAPTGLTATGVVAGIRITWNASTEADLEEYILYRHTSNLPGSSTEIWRGRAREFVDRSCSYGVNYYYWLKAVDTSGNISGFSSLASGCPVQRGQATAIDISQDSLTIELMKPGLKPYSSTLTFLPWTTSPHDSVQWAAGQIDYADGGSWGIYASNFQYIGSASCPCGNGPGCSGQMHYIYFTSTSHYLSCTNIMENAFSDTKGLLAQVYVSQIEATADIGIITYKAKGDNIVVDFLAVKMLSSIAANIGTITAGTIIGTLIKTAGSGARVQLDGASATKTLQLINSSEQVRFELKDDGTWYGGNPAGNYIGWNGSVLTVKGVIQIQSGTSGYGSISDKPTQLGDINSGEGTKLTGIEAGADVTGDHEADISLANLGEKNTSSLNQVSNYKLVTDQGQLGAGYAYAGLDTAGFVKKYIRSDKMGSESACVGLNFTNTTMGFYDGVNWRAWISSGGDWYFGNSDLSKYIRWSASLGYLYIKGDLYASNIYGANTIQSGGSFTVANKFDINTDGINIRGESLIFKDSGGNIRGHVFASSSDGIVIRNYGSVPITISMQNSQWFKIAGHTQPSSDNTYYLGDNSYRFKYFHLYGSMQAPTISNGVDYKCTDIANGAHMLGTWARYSDTSGDYWVDTDLRRRWNSSREFYIKNTSGGDRSTAWMLSA